MAGAIGHRRPQPAGDAQEDQAASCRPAAADRRPAKYRATPAPSPTTKPALHIDGSLIVRSPQSAANRPVGKHRWAAAVAGRGSGAGASLRHAGQLSMYQWWTSMMLISQMVGIIGNCSRLREAPLGSQREVADVVVEDVSAATPATAMITVRTSTLTGSRELRRPVAAVEVEIQRRQEEEDHHLADVQPTPVGRVVVARAADGRHPGTVPARSRGTGGRPRRWR